VNHDFSDEQKRYLEGFTAGVQIARVQFAGVNANKPVPVAEDIHRSAQDRCTAQGKKLTAEETAKRDRHPLDCWDELIRRARNKEFPEGSDVFRSKFFGLFYVAPTQHAYMCRLRIPNGILTSWQLRGIADLAETYGGAYTHVTTRANLQIREIAAAHGPAVLTGLQDIGIVNRGAGADNIRNITGSPTAGIDRQELIDTRPLARDLHHHILNHREYYGLPRKFNIAFDGGGAVSTVEDTNDIGFSAVRVAEGKSIAAGVYLHLQLGGITGHQSFARPTRILVTPEQCIPVCDAVIRLFIEHGDRTDRGRARLKYLIDAWGIDKFLEQMEQRLPFALHRARETDEVKRGPVERFAHIGFHPQQQPGRCYAGVVLPAGKLTSAQMRGLAEIAAQYGDGDIRLTVWQNLLLSGIQEANTGKVKHAVEALGLHWSAHSIRAGLIACTGNTGCRFAASDTKSHALRIAQYLEQRVSLDQPINIHLTGCRHSCAQHYIGDIGLLACRIVRDDDERELEGYHVYLGGGFGSSQRIAVELLRNVNADDVPGVLEKILNAYLQQRASREEDFQSFVSRHDCRELLHMMEQAQAVRAA
jgi:ferredoxin-nitrite reductase